VDKMIFYSKKYQFEFERMSKKPFCQKCLLSTNEPLRYCRRVHFRSSSAPKWISYELNVLLIKKRSSCQ